MRLSVYRTSRDNNKKVTQGTRTTPNRTTATHTHVHTDMDTYSDKDIVHRRQWDRRDTRYIRDRRDRDRRKDRKTNIGEIQQRRGRDITGIQMQRQTRKRKQKQTKRKQSETKRTYIKDGTGRGRFWLASLCTRGRYCAGRCGFALGSGGCFFRLGL